MTRSMIGSIVGIVLVVVACGAATTVTSRTPIVTAPPHSPAPWTPGASDSVVPADLAHIWFRKAETTMQWKHRGTWILGLDRPPDLKHGDDAESTVRAIDADLLQLVSALDADGCRSGDTGTYRWSLSDSRRAMSLAPQADECARRMADLSGVWILSDCPAYPEDFCLGPLDAGPHVANFFAPLLPIAAEWRLDPVAMSYRVPDGWSNTYDAANEYTLEPRVRTGNTGVYMWTDVTIVADETPCSVRPRVGGRASPDEFVAWLVEQETLDTAEPAQVVIGGLEGLSVDLTVVPRVTLPCTGDGTPYAPFLVHVEGSGLQSGFEKETRNRLYFLETGNGRTLVIHLASEGGNADQLLAEEIAIVESIELRR
jgi:hypothetical protein